MSDTRFSGRKIYRHTHTDSPEFEIHGDHVHKAHSGIPIYKIRGNIIEDVHTNEHAFVIKGDQVYDTHSASLPRFDIR